MNPVTKLTEEQKALVAWLFFHLDHVFLDKKGGVECRNGFPRDFGAAGGDWDRLKRCVAGNVREGAVPGVYDKMDVRKYIGWQKAVKDYFSEATA